MIMRQGSKRFIMLSVAVILVIGMVANPAAGVGEMKWFPQGIYDFGAYPSLSEAGSDYVMGKNISRALFYTALARMDNAEINDDQATNLKDVPGGQWYTGSVVWALTSGLTTCQGGDWFGSKSQITRVEICLALFRYDRYSGAKRLNSNALSTFVDMGRLIGEERLAVAACQDGGIVQSREDGRFDPYAGVTRMEAAEMIDRYYNLLPQKPRDSSNSETGNGILPASSNAKGWLYRYEEDFPLANLSPVTEEAVLELNSRIIYENLPANIAPLGETIDGDKKHLTNYGLNGIHDCWDIKTNRYNKNNQVEEGTALNGRQEYYGYSLQTGGLVRQDMWHKTAEDSGKEPWQCTWWVWGRAAQYVAEAYEQDFKTLCGGEDNFGHGKSYYAGLSDYFVSDQTPAPNSVISWSCGAYGHVAYVEAVDAGGIWVSMADSGHTWRGITYIPRVDSASNPYPLHWYAEETLNGFNHLDRPLNTGPLVREVIE